MNERSGLFILRILFRQKGSAAPPGSPTCLADR
jgi:hypothetical protein